MKQLKGIYTALLTPFTKEGKINEKELARLVRYNLALGADGGVGSTYNFMADKFVLIRKDIAI